MNRDRPADWPLLLAGLAAVYLLFEGGAQYLSSVRGEYGLPIAAAVVLALFAVERTAFAEPAAIAATKLGLGRPALRGVLAAAAVGALLVAVIPAFAIIRGSTLGVDPDWWWLVPGLFAQAGIAEENVVPRLPVRHLRERDAFWPAARRSMVPFAMVHLMLFATLPWPIALASMLLAIVISLPLAHAFEIGGNTIWGAAILHFIIQGAIKLAIVGGDAATEFLLSGSPPAR